MHEQLNRHKSGIFWFTGLSGAGKTTLALAVERKLVIEYGIRCVVLDGDRLRLGLNRDLGFSEADRWENMRRTSEVAELFLEQGYVVLVPMITPYEAIRKELRSRFKSDHYAEIYVACSLEACEDRDPKGLYRRARAGEIQHFTGIDAAFDTPMQPDLIIQSELDELSHCTAKLVNFVKNHVIQ